MTSLLSAQSGIRAYIAARLPRATVDECRALAQIENYIDTAIREHHATQTALESLSAQLDKALATRTSRRAA